MATLYKDVDNDLINWYFWFFGLSSLIRFLYIILSTTRKFLYFNFLYTHDNKTILSEPSYIVCMFSCCHFYKLTKLWFVLKTKYMQQKSNTYSKIKTNRLKTVQLSFVFSENIHATLQILGRIGIQIEKGQLEFQLVTLVFHFQWRS